jgi:hypothetical protein
MTKRFSMQPFPTGGFPYTADRPYEEDAGPPRSLRKCSERNNNALPREMRRYTGIRVARLTGKRQRGLGRPEPVIKDSCGDRETC